MIKVYKLKTIVIVLLVIALITGFILILKNKQNYKSVQTSNNNSKTYKILVDVEDSKLFLFENNELIKTYKCSGGKISMYYCIKRPADNCCRPRRAIQHQFIRQSGVGHSRIR